MTVTVVVPAALRSCAGGSREVAVNAENLGDVFDQLGKRHPVLERRIRDERGALRPHVLVFVDGVMVRGEDDIDRALHDGSEVFIAPAVSGG